MARLIERVVADEHLTETLVDTVRTAITDIAPLAPTDVAGYTRALLTAGTRAVVDLRGPTEAELTFVEELAVTRAGQGVPVEAVLAAIHLSSRALWARARELAAEQGVGDAQLLEAREVYDDWAETVRARLISAHRRASAEQEPARGSRDVALLRRLLAGGVSAALAATEAGYRESTLFHVAVARPGDATTVARFEAALRGRKALLGRLDGLLVAVLTEAPGRLAEDAPLIGVAGPGVPDDLDRIRAQALAALGGAELGGRVGPHHVADLPTLAALSRAGDLGVLVTARHRAARARLEPHVHDIARAVVAWVEHDRDVPAAARSLFVHPNTVRNRLQRFTEVTGVDPQRSFEAIDAWWLCRGWLAEG